VLALASLVVVRAALAQVFLVPSNSMEPTLHEGDYLLALRPWWTGGVDRGELIVFDGRGSLLPGTPVTGLLAGQLLPKQGAEEDPFFVKRVIGLPGEAVACCDAAGRVTIDGRPLQEPYLADRGVASEQPFAVVVPPDRVFVMGDNRDESLDSRGHLGDPGSGTVPLDAVVGEVRAILWPLARVGPVDQTGPVFAPPVAP
jgi:signal peptidase I